MRAKLSPLAAGQHVAVDGDRQVIVPESLDKRLHAAGVGIAVVAVADQDPPHARGTTAFDIVRGVT